MYPLIGDVGTPELLIIFAVVMLVFGGSKLPDLARGSGRAIRIFKDEVSKTDEPTDETTESAPSAPAEPVASSDAAAQDHAPRPDQASRG